MGELDKIINDGKVNTATALVVFAVEIKALQVSMDDLKKAFKDDSNHYVPRNDFVGLEQRVARLENAGLKILAFVFFLVLGAVVTLVVRTK